MSTAAAAAAAAVSSSIPSTLPEFLHSLGRSRYFSRYLLLHSSSSSSSHLASSRFLLRSLELFRSLIFLSQLSTTSSVFYTAARDVLRHFHTDQKSKSFSSFRAHLDEKHIQSLIDARTLSFDAFQPLYNALQQFFEPDFLHFLSSPSGQYIEMASLLLDSSVSGGNSFHSLLELARREFCEEFPLFVVEFDRFLLFFREKPSNQERDKMDRVKKQMAEESSAIVLTIGGKKEEKEFKRSEYLVGDPLPESEHDASGEAGDYIHKRVRAAIKLFERFLKPRAEYRIRVDDALRDSLIEAFALSVRQYQLLPGILENLEKVLLLSLDQCEKRLLQLFKHPEMAKKPDEAEEAKEEVIKTPVKKRVIRNSLERPSAAMDSPLFATKLSRAIIDFPLKSNNVPTSPRSHRRTRSDDRTMTNELEAIVTQMSTLPVPDSPNGEDRDSLVLPLAPLSPASASRASLSSRFPEAYEAPHSPTIPNPRSSLTVGTPQKGGNRLSGLMTQPPLGRSMSMLGADSPESPLPPVEVNLFQTYFGHRVGGPAMSRSRASTLSRDELDLIPIAKFIQRQAQLAEDEGEEEAAKRREAEENAGGAVINLNDEQQQKVDLGFHALTEAINVEALSIPDGRHVRFNVQEEGPYDRTSTAHHRRRSSILKARLPPPSRDPSLSSFSSILEKRSADQRRYIDLLQKPQKVLKYHRAGDCAERIVAVSEDGTELIWGKFDPKTPEKFKNTLLTRPNRRPLADCKFIAFGPLYSKQFLGYEKEDFPPWLAFSLFFPDRSLDFVCSTEQQMSLLFLGLQSLTPLNMHFLTRPAFHWRKLEMKIRWFAKRSAMSSESFIRGLIWTAKRQTFRQHRGKPLLELPSFTPSAPTGCSATWPKPVTQVEQSIIEKIRQDKVRSINANAIPLARKRQPRRKEQQTVQIPLFGKKEEKKDGQPDNQAQQNGAAPAPAPAPVPAPAASSAPAAPSS